MFTTVVHQLTCFEGLVEMKKVRVDLDSVVVNISHFMSHFKSISTAISNHLDELEKRAFGFTYHQNAP